MNASRDPSAKELREARRIRLLPKFMRKNHPKSIKSDVSKLDHINTYGDLPSHYSTPSYVAHAEKKKYGKLKIRNGITKNQKDTSMRKQFIAIHADNLGVAATNLKTTPNKTD